MPQSLSSVLIHLVFSTKNRQPLITPAIEPELLKYLAVELHNMGCPSLAINGASDHIHILFTLSRTLSIANVVKSIKGSSSRWISFQDEFRALLQKYEVHYDEKYVWD